MGDRLRYPRRSTATAHNLVPDDVTYAYGYAIELHSTGRSVGAVKVLHAAYAGHPVNAEVFMSLVTILREQPTR